MKRCHMPGPETLTLRMCVSVCSRSAALDESWVQADVSDVMSVQQPGEETLQTQTVTAVRTRAVLPLKHTHTAACYYTQLLKQAQ